VVPQQTVTTRADLGPGGFQLAQLEAGEALVRQGLHNGYKGVQVRHWLPVQLCEPVQGIQAVPVGWRAVVPPRDIHPRLCWGKP